MAVRPQFQVQVAGHTVHLGQRTLIMGVLNVTPDSFSDGGRYFSLQRAVAHGVELARAGADWIDVGGESTRPGAEPVSAEEELRRVIPVIQRLREMLPAIPISVDTTKAVVAEEALRAGASVVNDVSGLRFDPAIADVARAHRAPLILMHLRGRPATMQQGPFTRSIWRSVIVGLNAAIRRALARGVRREQLIIDPGLGFGKTRRQNYEIAAGLRRLRRFHLPVMVGASRKSFVQAVVAGEGLAVPGNSARSGRLWPLAERTGRGSPAARKTRRAPQGSKQPPLLEVGDAAFTVATILAGAHIVRVHDVASILPAVRIADAILSVSSGQVARRP
jgi:dihydropteroate synthase